MYETKTWKWLSRDSLLSREKNNDRTYLLFESRSRIAIVVVVILLILFLYFKCLCVCVRGGLKPWFLSFFLTSHWKYCQNCISFYLIPLLNFAIYFCVFGYKKQRISLSYALFVVSLAQFEQIERKNKNITIQWKGSASHLVHDCCFDLGLYSFCFYTVFKLLLIPEVLHPLSK